MLCVLLVAVDFDFHLIRAENSVIFQYDNSSSLSNILMLQLVWEVGIRVTR